MKQCLATIQASPLMLLCCRFGVFYHDQINLIILVFQCDEILLLFYNSEIPKALTYVNLKDKISIQIEG